ncbi:MAG: hypothetical protein ACRDPY_14055 [Streptosporangiaceae bacterium]
MSGDAHELDPARLYIPPNRPTSGNRQRWKSQITSLLPIVVSVAALVVSVFAFMDQHNVDENAVKAAKEIYAERVSYWLIPVAGMPYAPKLIVQNLSSAPVSVVAVTMYTGTYGRLNNRVSYGLGIIPPCSIDTTRVQQQAAIIAWHACECANH